MNRREMIKMTGAAALGVTVLGLPAAASDNGEIVDSRRRKIMVIGAHPDDPETGCGGTKRNSWQVHRLSYLSERRLCYRHRDH